MTKILMVCLGNICRSPLAHGILQSKLPEAQCFVDSAGTANYHSGSAPDHRSIKVAKHHNIDISQQQARQFTTHDFDVFDCIYVMDESNYDNVLQLARTNDDIEKVKLILEVDDTISNKNVPDPYYGGLSDFEKVYQLLDYASDILVSQLH